LGRVQVGLVAIVFALLDLFDQVLECLDQQNED
jgi:hypothetical protein